MKRILYDEMSWPEVREAVKQERVPLIPVGSTEQHGPHLPTKTDALLTFEVCKAVAEKIPDIALVMPAVSYGYNEHHFDFPATIHIDHETLIRFVIDIGKSLAYHGFKRMIIVNGHGSNQAPMEIAARRITLETNAICASLGYWAIAPEAYKLLRGQSSHACDLETSLMLYLAPELVDMSKAVRDWNVPKSKFIRYGVEPGGDYFAAAGGSVQFMDWWSRMSRTGIVGDPTKADGERGRQMFEMFVGKLAEFVEEFKRRKILPRRDYH
ncbi:MAG: creatininase family protein [Nitrososphaeria archaeon]